MSSKTKSRAPQDFKKKAKREIATAASWGTKKLTGNVELDLPSGNTVLVKRVDLPTLLASGAFPDTLMAIVSEKIETATGKSDKPTGVDPENVKDVLKDPAKLSQLFEAMDRVLPIVVAQPVVFNHKQLVRDEYGNEIADTYEVIPDEQRIEDIVYTDQVDLEDKMFIFQFCVGGTREVEDFREELTSTVADVSSE